MIKPQIDVVDNVPASPVNRILKEKETNDKENIVSSTSPAVQSIPKKLDVEDDNEINYGLWCCRSICLCCVVCYP